MGDTVCAVPAFRLIRQNFPAAELILVSDESHSALSAQNVAASLHLFDRFIEYPARRGWRTIVSLLLRVVAARADVAILLPQGREHSADVLRKRRLFQLCGIRDVRATQLVRDPRAALMSEPDRLIALLHAVGLSGEKPPYGIPVDNKAKLIVQNRLRDAGFAEDQPFVVFCGGGKAKTQQWPLERYAAVLTALNARAALATVAVGGVTDFGSYARELVPRVPTFRPVETRSVSELFELCRLSAGYIGNDTGPMHVAAALGRPVAVIMSGRNPPGEWDPDVERRLVIREPVECENCFLRECVERAHQCMTSISVERVIAEAVPFFATAKAANVRT